METLRELFRRHVGQTSPSPYMVEVERADGVFFYAPDGKKYYDLIAGVNVSNVGHNNPAVVEAVTGQASRYMHMMVYGELVERPQVEYARLIADSLPDPLESVYFVNSGAEAIEGALKLAKRHTGRTELISCRNAYHGSTHGALSVMGAETYKNAFRPLLPDTRLISYNNFDDLELISGRTAAVLVEPVQAEAGVVVPVEGWLEALREKCNDTGTLLIFDEIQTGMGRTGRMFGMDTYGVKPDIVCLAKAFGGGMPLGGFVSSRDIMERLTHDPVLGHITTFGGHPVCCAAGLAAARYIMDHRLYERAETCGARYQSLLSGHPAVREIRRTGLLLAVELGNSGKMYRAMELFLEAGIMSDWFLFCDTAFRISPPLTITDQEVDHSAGLVLSVLDKL